MYRRARRKRHAVASGGATFLEASGEYRKLLDRLTGPKDKICGDARHPTGENSTVHAPIGHDRLLHCIMSACGTKRTCRLRSAMSASLIGRLRSSAFRLSTTAASASLAGSCFSSESAQGPSSMGSEDKVEQSLGRPCPMTGPSGHANSPHPSSREGRHSTAWWSSKYPPIAFDPERTSYRCSSSGPSELAAISPDAVHNDGQASR